MNETRKIGVVYLMWVPYGIGHFISFINSYSQYQAGEEHDLIICFNGLKDENELKDYFAILNENMLKAVIFKMPAGQDIEAYRYVAENVLNEYLVFFNTFSIFQNVDWLKNYYRHISNKEVGLIGATASKQSYYSSVFQKHSWHWETDKGFLYNFRKYKLFIKAFVYWRFLFSPFPNPHIRTTGFMVRRIEFLQIRFETIDSKFKAYQFESGRKSMTAHYLKKGFKILLMDKYGATYEPAEWGKASAFWIDEQEGLLVSDNQTTIYRMATNEEKKSMTKLAWGL